MKAQGAPSDGARLVFSLLYAAWVMVFVFAFVAYARAPHEAAGFPDGLNKPRVYLGWQGIAGMLALAVFGVGRRWPKGGGVRTLSALPLVVAVLHLVLIGAVYLWAGGA